MVRDIQLVSSGQLSQPCPPETSWPPPAYSLGVGKVGESFYALQALFSKNQNTGVLSTLLQPQIQSTAPPTLL